MPTARGDLAVVTGHDGTIYALGGIGNSWQALSAVEAYAPSTDSWSTLPSMPTPWQSPGAAVGPDGKIYVFEGPQVEAFDPQTGIWTCSAKDTAPACTSRTLTPMPGNETDLDAETLGDGRITVESAAGVRVYDPTTNAWTCATGDLAGGCAHYTLPPQPSGTLGPSVDIGHDVYIFGNGNSTMFDTASNKWHCSASVTSTGCDFHDLANPPTFTSGIGTYGHFDIAADGQGRIYRFGGEMTGYDFWNTPWLEIYTPIPTDTTPPVITPAVVGTLGDNNWYTSDVNVSWTVTDSESAITSENGCSSQSITTDTGGVTLTCSATSSGGTAINSVTIKRDTTSPVVGGTPDRAPDRNGWYNHPFSVSWNASGDLSGVASCNSNSAVTGPDSANATVSGHCTDGAGNVGTGMFPFQYDGTGPALNISAAPDLTAFSVCGSGPIRPTFNPVDALSGLDGSQSDSWTTPTTATGVGTYVYHAQATDLAGNTSAETRTYTRTYGNAASGGAFSGFLPPINASGSSDFKIGSTIPVKFQLLCNGSPITNAVAKVTVKRADGTAAPGNDVPTSSATSTTGNLLRYDNSSEQYIFNLSTKLGYANPDGSRAAYATGAWSVSILLDDGTARTANFQLVN